MSVCGGVPVTPRFSGLGLLAAVLQPLAYGIEPVTFSPRAEALTTEANQPGHVMVF